MPRYSKKDLERGLREALSKSPRMEIHMDWDQVVVMVAHLQLALRHPGNTGWSAQQARILVDGVIESIQTLSPLFAACLRQGDDPRCDVPLKRERSDFLYCVKCGQTLADIGVAMAHKCGS